MRTYDTETLKHLQQIELMILKDFVDTCEANDIRDLFLGMMISMSACLQKTLTSFWIFMTKSGQKSIQL